jgi:hypothetical protein
VHTFEHSYQILSVAFDGSGERIFAGTLDDGIMVFDLKEREPAPFGAPLLARGLQDAACRD